MSPSPRHFYALARVAPEKLFDRQPANRFYGQSLVKTMKLSEWASFDVKSLPLDVLKSIYLDSQRELTRRREMDKVSRKVISRNTGLAQLPNQARQFSHRNFRAYDDLISQDWSNLYQSGSTDRQFYVYAHIAPSRVRIEHEGAHCFKCDGLPFYIGKGTGQRAWDLSRNEGHGKELAQLKAMGLSADKIVHIVKDEMTEPEALELEAKLIYFFGTRFERHRSGILVNLTIPQTPFH